MPRTAKPKSSDDQKPYSSSSVKAEPSETQSQPSSPSKSPTKPSATGELSAKAWTAEETWQLYQMIHPKPAEIPWKEVCKSFPGKDEQVSWSQLLPLLHLEDEGLNDLSMSMHDHRAAETGTETSENV
jgi:hypothetical protein